ncbi:MAG: bestrophin family protein [Flavobacteriales bacterium]|nr:bestrophin family protein [Flavobacteriales bacterium]
MIAYDPRSWLKPVLQFHKADTFRKLFPLMVLLGALCTGIAWLEVEHLRMNENSHLRNVTMMHNLLGLALSVLLVFRTNTAYDRWWEGRKLWGQLVNCSRNLAVKISVMVDPSDTGTRSFFARIIGLFAYELKHHLRQEGTRLELDSEPHPEIPGFDSSRHIPAQAVQLMQQRVHRLHREGQLSGEQLIVLNTELVQFLDICGACERIKNSPIPYSYSTFIKKFISAYAITLPFGFVIPLGYWAIPIVVFIFYVFASLELIAEEIEDPFGTDVNDLPMDRLSEVIARNAKEILD